MSRGRWALVVCLLLAGLAAPGPARGADPVRILVLGDSVAQGSAGDWTWRYRLWQALTASGADVDFVGPRDDVWDNVAGQAGSTAYADPAFDRDHGSFWGTSLSSPYASIQDLVADYRPDVVIETRGYDDLTWLEQTPEQVLGMLHDEVVAARSVDADVDFVLGEHPQRWMSAVPGFDALLPGFAADLSDDRSRVVAAATGSGFVQGVDTYDPAHLTASGEVKMAAGMADALATLGVGAPYPRPLPVVDNGHWGAPALTLTPGSGGTAALRWRRPPGADLTWVWTRELGRCEPWHRLPIPLTSDSWTAGGLAAGHAYQFRLQSAKGSVPSSTFSNVAQVGRTPGPCPVGGLAVSRGSHALTVRFAPGERATSYLVRWSSARRHDRGSRVVRSGPVVLRGLVAGDRYTVTVVPRSAQGSGPARSVRAVPRGPVVAAPMRVRVRSAGVGVRLSWAASRGATAYDVWRLVHRRWRLVGTTTGRSLVVRGIGSGRVGLRVRARHQLVPGGWSRIVHTH